jgi:hypothetical protein
MAESASADHGYQSAPQHFEGASDDSAQLELVQYKDWHIKEHILANVTDRLINENVLPTILRKNTQARHIGRMLLYDERFSTVMGDTREPEEKPTSYYRARLKSYTSKQVRNRH